MADIYSREKRSIIMSRVRGRGNRRTELRVVELFRTHKIHGWRRNVAIAGKPDFVFPERKLALFVDGCFWHSCSEHGSIPTDNRSFWKKKLTLNKVRDRSVDKSLRSCGWRVLRIWQHDLAKRNEHMVIRRVRAALAKAAQVNGT
jgi:DNA mismatch endonuclease (patch repair protein)